jgi:hypothetical protein
MCGSDYKLVFYTIKGSFVFCPISGYLGLNTEIGGFVKVFCCLRCFCILFSLQSVRCLFYTIVRQNAGVGLMYPVHVYSILFLKLFVSQSLVYLYAIVRVLRA